MHRLSLSVGFRFGAYPVFKESGGLRTAHEPLVRVLLLTAVSLRREERHLDGAWVPYCGCASVLLE